MSVASNLITLVPKSTFGHPEATYDLIQTLCRLAVAANRLAKTSSGRNRVGASRIKVDAINTLIEKGGAKANSIDAHGIVGLDLKCQPPSGLHVPIHFLQPAARELVLEQTASSRAAAQVADCFEFTEWE